MSTVVTSKVTPLSHSTMKRRWEKGQLPMLWPSLPACVQIKEKRRERERIGRAWNAQNHMNHITTGQSVWVPGALGLLHAFSVHHKLTGNHVQATFIQAKTESTCSLIGWLSYWLDVIFVVAIFSLITWIQTTLKIAHLSKFRLWMLIIW